MSKKLICALCGKEIDPKSFYKSIHTHNVHETSTERIPHSKKRNGYYEATYKDKKSCTLHSDCMIKLTGTAW